MKIKLLLLAMLAAAALLCLTATLVSIGALDGTVRGGKEYLVRERDGLVCVYRLPDTVTPLFVSDVRPETLPARMRAGLVLGIAAEDYSELRSILQNMGT